MRTDQSGARDGICVCINQVSSTLGSTLSLSTEDWRLCFSGWVETPKLSCQCRALADQRSVRQTSKEQNISASWKGAQSQGHPWLLPQPCCFHSCAVSLLSCFALNKVSFFTAFQNGDSCCCWIGANDHWVMIGRLNILPLVNWNVLHLLLQSMN